MSVHVQAPLKIPVSDDFYTARYSTVKKFLDSVNARLPIKITVRYIDTLDDGRAVGLWVDSDNFPYPYYVPITTIMLPDLGIESAPETFIAPGKPISNISYVKHEHKIKTLGSVLMEYALAIASRVPDGVFNNDYFEIEDNHDYDLEGLHHRIDLTNTNFVYNGRLIVPSVTIANRLISYVSAMKKNDPDGYEEYRNHKFLQNDLNDPMDFDDNKDTYIFTDESHIDDFIESKHNNDTINILRTFPNPQRLALVYGHSSLTRRTTGDGKLGPCILQFVKANKMKNALKVCFEWNDTNVNIGYGADSTDFTRDKVKNLDIFDVRDHTWDGTYKKTRKSDTLYLAKFDTNSYAALLPTTTAEI